MSKEHASRQGNRHLNPANQTPNQETSSDGVFTGGGPRLQMENREVILSPILTLTKVCHRVASLRSSVQLFDRTSVVDSETPRPSFSRAQDGEQWVRESVIDQGIAAGIFLVFAVGKPITKAGEKNDHQGG
jgi:hypothetical protein